MLQLFDFFQFEYDFLQERNKIVSPFSSFQLSNALKCKPEQDFLVPFYPNPCVIGLMHWQFSSSLSSLFVEMVSYPFFDVETHDVNKSVPK